LVPTVVLYEVNGFSALHWSALNISNAVHICYIC